MTIEAEPGTVDGYTERTPNEDTVALMRDLMGDGHTVILWTGRRESRRRITEDWLDLHSVPYDFLFMGKPSFDVFVDDKMRTPEQIRKERDDEVQGLRPPNKDGRSFGRPEGTA